MADIELAGHFSLFLKKKPTKKLPKTNHKNPSADIIYYTILIFAYGGNF